MVHACKADAALPVAHAAMVRAEVALNPAVFKRVVKGCLLHGGKIIDPCAGYFRELVIPSILAVSTGSMRKREPLPWKKPWVAII